jgi:hypothetical protein
MTPERKLWLERLEVRGRSPATMRNYEQALIKAAVFHDCSPLGMSTGQIEQFLLHELRVEKRAPSTVNLHIAAFRSFYELVAPESVIKYLGRYTHRVAISNQRLLALRDGNVTFSYTDHRRGGVRKTMTLAATEFIRRFLMHVVPDGFVRIRHYGFLANAVREDKLARCRTALGVAQPTQDTSMKDTHWYTIVEQLTGRDPLLCPRCRKGKLRVWKELAPLHSSREAAA